jgi:hypothetical protein
MMLEVAFPRTQMDEITHAYEVRPLKDHRGKNLISDALPFGLLWYGARIVFDCRMANDLSTINRKGQMKIILMLIVGLMLAGCGSMENHVHNRDAVDAICACP